MNPEIDEDAMIAAVELVHRSGATSCEFGHLDDDVPIEEARWWAKAQYQGAILQAENHRDPIAALEALARRVLKGAKCVGCDRTVSLSGDAAMQASRCRWTREGRHWMPACPSGRKRLEARLEQQGAP